MTTASTGTFDNSISWSQTFYRGGQNIFGMRKAELSIRSGRATLAQTEKTVLLSGISAYMNILRDYSIRDLRKKNVETLRKRLETTQIQFDLEQKTLADLSQAQSRYVREQASLTAIEGTVKFNEANFQRVIGVSPSNLVFPSAINNLPDRLKDSVEIAVKQSLSVLSARYNIGVAEQDVNIANGARLPTVSLATTYSRNRSDPHGVDDLDSTTRTASGSLTLSIPIYQTGSELSSVRAAKFTLAQKRLQLDAAYKVAEENVIKAWNDLKSSKARVVSFNLEVKATQTARDNVAAELEIGRRTLLDYLHAEQEALNAEVSLVTARRDVVVFSYTLLGALGNLNAKTIELQVKTYNPDADFRRQKFNFFNTSID